MLWYTAWAKIVSSAGRTTKLQGASQDLKVIRVFWQSICQTATNSLRAGMLGSLQQGSRSPHFCNLVHLCGIPLSIEQFSRGGVRLSALFIACAGNRNFSHNVPNAFMASSRGHDFWNFCVRQMLVRVAKAQMSTYEGEWWDHVEQTAGPAMLHASLQVWLCSMR